MLLYICFLFFFSVGFPFSPFARSGFLGLDCSRLAGSVLQMLQYLHNFGHICAKSLYFDIIFFDFACIYQNNILLLHRNQNKNSGQEDKSGTNRMKTKNYKTLEGLIRSSRQLSFNNILSGRFCHKTIGLAKFSLPESERLKAYNLLASVVYSKRNTQHGVELMLHYCGREYGIFNRLCFDNHTGRPEYIAGQDYDSEIRTIQYLLRKNV